MPHAGRKPSSSKNIKPGTRITSFEIEIGRFRNDSLAGINLVFYKETTGNYQVYSHYATNNKASILALVKNPLFA